ncbi:PAS domain-containing sensor histidine kinase [Hymenobacter sp. YC55]|nr:PAS domain-containing sensor histidine kinase [Hymenobacter sp. YC55]
MKNQLVPALPLPALAQALLEVSPSGLLILRPLTEEANKGEKLDFVVLHGNAAAHRLLHWPDATGTILLSELPSALALAILSSCQQLCEAGLPFLNDTISLPDDSRTLWQLAIQRSEEMLVVSLASAPTLESQPEAAAASTTPAQVRDLQRAEQSEARFQRLAETTPMVVWEANAEGHTTYLSPHWERFTSADNGQGLGWKEYMHPDDQAAFLEAWLTAVRSAQPFQAEMRLRIAATGEYRWHLDRAVPVFDAAGHVTQWVGAAIDIHELKHLQQTLLESEQYFRAMADHVPAMIWVTNPQGHCTYLNQQWYAYTGQTEAQALGIGWLEAVHPDDAPAARAAFSEANTQRISFRVLYRLRRSNGRYRWALDAGMPRFNAAGEYEGIVGTVLDIHERQLAEQGLQRLARQLRQSRDEAQTLNAELRTINAQLMRTNADLDNFIYTASHDLKAPITNIDGLLDALQHQLPPAAREADLVLPIIGMMQEAVERFKKTIDHLTDITKLQQEHALQSEPVDVAAVVEDVRQDLLPILRETGAQLEIDLSACPTLLFSVKNLRSIVYNLLSNALKYRHPDRLPYIRLACSPAGDNWQVLTVQDNGLGLALAQQAHLFRMFQRMHDHVDGSGIGLYMVKKMVENAGGTIGVESEEGVGSIFSVYLPC